MTECPIILAPLAQKRSAGKPSKMAQAAGLDAGSLPMAFEESIEEGSRVVPVVPDPLKPEANGVVPVETPETDEQVTEKRMEMALLERWGTT